MIDGFVAGTDADDWTRCERRETTFGQRIPVRLPDSPLTSKQPLRLRLQFALLATDALCIATALAISCFIRFGTIDDERAFRFLVLLLPSYIVVAANGRAYGLEALVDLKAGVERALLALATTAALLAALLFYLKTSTLYSRQVVGAGVLGSAILLPLGRYTLLKIARRCGRLTLTNDVLVIDGAPIRPEPGAIVIIADTSAAEEWNPGVLSRIGSFLRHADRVVVAASEDRRAHWVMALKGVGIDIELLAAELARVGPIGLRRYGSHPTLVVGSKPLGLADSLKKRALDLAIAVSALVVLAPIMLLIALAIKLDSKGPVLFRQTRLGLGNCTFQICKFRTMRVESEDGEGARSTTRNDDRVTRIGAFLRRTSLDELPQLFNVLIGNMSIVGPRPHALGSTAEEALFWIVDSRYWERHGMKPGITGLAQVRGYRGATESRSDLINRVHSDLEYRVGWSVFRDLAIVLRTVCVLLHPNAF